MVLLTITMLLPPPSPCHHSLLVTAFMFSSLTFLLSHVISAIFVINGIIVCRVISVHLLFLWESKRIHQFIQCEICRKFEK